MNSQFAPGARAGRRGMVRDLRSMGGETSKRDDRERTIGVLLVEDHRPTRTRSRTRAAPGSTGWNKGTLSGTLRLFFVDANVGFSAVNASPLTAFLQKTDRSQATVGSRQK